MEITSSFQKIRFQLVRELSPSMEELRRLRYLGADSTVNSEDEFDSISYHVLANSDDGRVIATTRFTDNPPKIIESWSNGAVEMPSGLGIRTFSRTVVSEEAEKVGLQRLLLCESFIRAERMNTLLGVGVVEPTLPINSLLKKLGWRHYGEVVNYFEPIGIFVVVQPVVLAFKPNQSSWLEMYRREVERLHRHGVSVETDCTHELS